MVGPLSGTASSWLNMPEKKESRTEPVPLRSIVDIIADLSKPLPVRFLKTKPVKNTELVFIPWYHVVRLLDHFATGWSYDISYQGHAGKIVIEKATISIPCLEGVVSRSAIGSEDDAVTGYGDPTSNSESMALRRAAAKFGLGLYLYDK